MEEEDMTTGYSMDRRRFMALSAMGLTGAALGLSMPANAASPENWSGTFKLNERSTPGKLKYWEQLGARFTANSPNLKFVVEPNDSGPNYDTKLLTGSISKTAGDIAWFATTQNFNLFQSKNLLQPLDDLIKADGYDLSPFMAKVLEAVTVEGRLYTLPVGFHGGPISMFYNKKLFDEAGIAYPTPDWSIADFETAAVALTRPDRDQFGAMLPLDNPEALVVLSRFWGGDIIKAGGTESALLDDPTREMFEWISRLVNDLKVMKRPADMPRLASGGIDYNGFFGSDKVAMWQGSPWHANLLRTALGPEEFAARYAMTLMPNGPAGRHGQLVADCYAILRNTPNLEAAWEFHKLTATREEGVSRIDYGFTASPRMDAAQDPGLMAKDPFYAIYNQALFDNPPQPASIPANYKITEMYAMLRLSFDAIWAGSQSVANTLQTADAALSALLSDA
jgi:multiple sugar transport system substrate-binding protein